MRAYVPSPDVPGRTALADVPEPGPGPNEALVSVEAYSINRGEVFLLESPRAGWRPGQDIAGRVERAAADGGGPAARTRVVGNGAWSTGWRRSCASSPAGICIRRSA